MADRIKFYTDEHIAKAVARGLRQRGVDVLRSAEAGMLGASDEEHLARATAEGRVLVTHDRDYPKLAVRLADHAGLVYAPRQMSIGAMIAALMLIYQVLEPADMIGHIEYV